MPGSTIEQPQRPLGTDRLSDRAIRAFIRDARSGKASSQKLFDGHGLYLTLTKAGTAVWRLKYTLGGRERVYAIGVYPAVSLAQARQAREEARALTREGQDPTKSRLVRRAQAVTSTATTFADVAKEWLATRQPGWSQVHYRISKRALERDVFPTLGRLPVRDITPSMIAAVIERVMDRDVRETAGKILQHINAVCRFAQARGIRDDNPAAPVSEILPRRRRVSRRPALLEIQPLRDLLAKADVAPISPAVRLAHRLCAFTAARIGNVVEADWSEFSLDSDSPEWRIPRAKMKAKDREHDHVIPLGPTIAADLRAWRARIGGRGFVFPSPMRRADRPEHVSIETIDKAYRVTLGLKDQHSPHGWRSSFSTLAREAGFAREVVELALDHIHDSDVARAYDRGGRRPERARLMQWWDQQLEPPREDGTRVLSFPSTGA